MGDLNKPRKAASGTVLAAALALSWACGDTSPDRPSEVELRRTNSPDQLVLSPGLLVGSEHTATATADLVVGGIDGFGHLADVAGFDDGRFAVLDRLNEQVTIHAADGGVVHTVGRAGGGPGEFSGPIVLARASDRLIVWDRDGPRTFSVFDTTGRFRALAPAEAEGDWRSHLIRSQWAISDDYGPAWHEPAEDLTHRLISFGDRYFLHVLQKDEQEAMFEHRDFPADPPAYVIRYDLEGTLIDTVAILTAAHSYFVNWQSTSRYPSFADIQLVGRPLIASGAGWWATAHGDSSAIAVRSIDEGRLLRISLPGEPRLLTVKDRQAWADRVIELAAEQYRGSDPGYLADIRSQRDELLKRVRFPETAPRVTATYGAGNCLWVSGFNPMDHVSGTSLTWTAINLPRRAIAGIVRIPRRGARVRDIDRYGIYASFRDDLGVFYLERYPVGHFGC